MLAESTLTRTQRAALTYLREDRQGMLWPAHQGRLRNVNTTPWSRRTLQALVDAGLAEWAAPRHGIMPHIIPTFWFQEELRYDRTKAPHGTKTCVSHRNTYVCTRSPRHIGPHLAGRSDGTVAAGWGQR